VRAGAPAPRTLDTINVDRTVRAMLRASAGRRPVPTSVVEVEQGVARLDERLTKDLSGELDAVRDAAADLLGLELSVPGPGERLEPDLGFLYLTREQAGQTGSATAFR
jgi:hypothetical protein